MKGCATWSSVSSSVDSTALVVLFSCRQTGHPSLGRARLSAILCPAGP